MTRRKKTISSTAGVSASTLEVVPDNSGEEYFRGLLESAKQNADTRISNYETNGYVTICMDGSGANRHSTGIVFTRDRIRASEKKDVESLKENHGGPGFWIWNYGGLAYYKRGSDSVDPIVAMTTDGAIVADFITTGTLTSITINACHLNGCTFRCEPVHGGHYIQMAEGKITGGLGSNIYGTFDATASITDYASSPAVRRKGFKIDCDALALDMTRLCVKWPSWITKTQEDIAWGVDHINGFTGTVLNVMSHQPDGTANYGNLHFVNGLLVDSIAAQGDEGVEYPIAERKTPW